MAFPLSLILKLLTRSRSTSSRSKTRSRTTTGGIAGVLIALAATWWNNRQADSAKTPTPPKDSKPPMESTSQRSPDDWIGKPATRGYDLVADEKKGGHTIERHVGRTDDQLRSRLRTDPDISASSTFTDLETASLTVASALTQNSSRIKTWKTKGADRETLALDYSGSTVIGRSLRRGMERPVDCQEANIVLAPRGTDSFIVLTAYPEASRGR
jgi:hypothetical protein